jgi:hypothetical protein
MLLLCCATARQIPSLKVIAMVVAVRKPQSLADRTLAIRENWSQAVRLRRAITGNRLRRAFAGRFASTNPESTVWAVGSLGTDDLNRLAQNG